MKPLKVLSPFLTTYLLFAAISTYFLVSYPKIELHLLINQYHNSIADVFFKYYTNVGDGAFAIVLLPFLFFKKIRDFVLCLLSCLFAGIFAQILKRLIFTNELRPSASISPDLLHLVSGVKMATQHSFPSGHSATALAFFMFLAYMFPKNKFLQILFAILGCLVAFSRIYLSQHFLGDALAGSFLGVLSFLTAYIIVKNIKNWKDISLYQLLFKGKKSA